jgi:hypothetical protein
MVTYERTRLPRSNQPLQSLGEADGDKGVEEDPRFAKLR